MHRLFFSDRDVDEKIAHGYPIDDAMVQGWSGRYRWFVATGIRVTRLHCGTLELRICAI